MPKLSAFTALCGATALVMVTGCSSNSITSPSGLSGANATEFSALGSSRVGLNHYNDPGATGIGGHPEISCPSQAPRISHSGTNGLRLELYWQPIYNVTQYQVQVEKRTETGWVLLVTETVDSVYYEVYGVEGGQYRLRVRSLICGNQGSWSDWMYESIDGKEDLTAPVVVIPEPTADPTTTYWFTDQGNTNARGNECTNLGQGSIGTYLGDVTWNELDGGVCQIVTAPGGVVLPPQPFWVPYDGPLP